MKVKLFTIPNALTLMNLLCGSFAVLITLTDRNLILAFQLILLAAVFDFLDGFVARLLKCPSEIGVQLDSLADMISFGLAPAMMLFAVYSQSDALFAWWPTPLGLVIFVMAAFAALRLAKFNIDDTQHTEFSGLPTPAAALFCGSLGCLVQTGDLSLSREVVVLIAALISALMVCDIRMFALKFRGFGWQGNELRYSFLILSVALLVLLGIKAVPVIILLYVIISTVRSVMSKIK